MAFLLLCFIGYSLYLFVKNRGLKKKIVLLEKLCSDSLNDFEVLKSEKDNLENSYKELILKLKSSIGSKEGEVTTDSLIAEISELKNQLANMSDYHSIKEKYAELKPKLEILKSGLENIKEYQNEVKLIDKLKQQINNLNSEIKVKENELNIILNEIKIQNDIYDKIKQLEDSVLFELYVNRYDFDGSKKYKDLLDNVIDKQKLLRADKKAYYCNTEWSIAGDKKKGAADTNNMLKLMASAFDGECEVLMNKVKFDNVVKFEEKIKTEFDIINKFGMYKDCHISEDYLNLKIEQLRIYHEYQEKLKEEKEEQRLIKEQMREEERVLREIEKAKEKAEKEEKVFENAIEVARKQIDSANEEQQKELQLKIESLQRQLEEAHQNKERALSMAQQTKRGHVYIISNIGSFGENIYKIGMTRRLEPLDRVKELGDASVPFDFDVHAIIFSENAPELENRLHRLFNDNRVNKVNYKKEYFTVHLDEIEKALNKEKIEYRLTKLAEAKEYRETLAIVSKFQNN